MTITLTREEAQQVLDAIKTEHSAIYGTSQTLKAIETLRAALAQPEPEPVAWLKNIADPQPRAVTDLKYRMACESSETWIPLYTTPSQREWVGLTDDERYLLMNTINPLEYAKAIEAKLKEKNS